MPVGGFKLLLVTSQVAAQSVSITRSFSATVIFSNGSVISICLNAFNVRFPDEIVNIRQSGCKSSPST